jgi:hypothetical protein
MPGVKGNATEKTHSRGGGDSGQDAGWAAENALNGEHGHTNKPLRPLAFALQLSDCPSSVHFD